MSILDRIRKLFEPEVTQAITTISETPKPPTPSDLVSVFKTTGDRISAVRRCREIYKLDPRGKRMLRSLARDIIRGGFEIQTTNTVAAEIAAALQQRLNLTMRLDDWVRLTARDGDGFLELGIDDNLDIALVTKKPTLQMGRNSNGFDLFDNPRYAFWWTDELYAGMGTPRQDDPAAVWFAEWQIIHARWDHDDGSRYGTPMLESGLAHYKKVQEGELDMAIRRKTRAGMKFLHVIEGGTEGDIEAYRELNQDALNNPFAAVADFFTNKSGSIQSIQGDAQLNQLDDVKHMVASWMQSGETPMELLGYGDDLNRDVLGEKAIEYRETLKQLREWVSDQLVIPLLERQWLLKGIYPKTLDYEIVWKANKVNTPAMVLAAGEAASRLAILGVSKQVIGAMLSQWLPGVDADGLFDTDNGVDYNVDTPRRIADVLASLENEGDDGEED